MNDIEFFIQDFKCWRPQPIIAEEELRIFKALFYYEDKTDPVKQRTFYRYREQGLDTGESILA